MIGTISLPIFGSFSRCPQNAHKAMVVDTARPFEPVERFGIVSSCGLQNLVSRTSRTGM